MTNYNYKQQYFSCQANFDLDAHPTSPVPFTLTALLHPTPQASYTTLSHAIEFEHLTI